MFEGIRKKDFKPSSYLLFEFLWIIVLLPKMIQLALFVVYAVWLSARYGRLTDLNKINICFLAYVFFHFMSIIAAIITRAPDFERIVAAFNTLGIWVVALWLSGLILKEDETDPDRVGKYCLVNMLIMFLLFTVTYFIPGFKIFNGLEIRAARIQDILLTGEVTRFCGLMEYPNLVGSFMLLQYPWAFRYICRNEDKRYCLLLIPISFIPVFGSNARMGTLLMAVLIFFSINYLMSDSGISLKKLLILYGILGFALIVLLILKWEEIFPFVLAIVNARPGSNGDRALIYVETIKRINETSWWIGAGVKDMNSSGNYPLGSHCTYLGIVYKAGILGALCVLAGILLTVRSVIKRALSSGDQFGFLFCGYGLVMLMYFIFEDIDGANWFIVIFFLTICIFHKVSYENLCDNVNL